MFYISLVSLLLYKERGIQILFDTVFGASDKAMSDFACSAITKS